MQRIMIASDSHRRHGNLAEAVYNEQPFDLLIHLGDIEGEEDIIQELAGVKVILADGGYRGELVDNIKKKFGYIIQVVISAYKKQGFRLIQKMDCRKNIFMDGLQ